MEFVLEQLVGIGLICAGLALMALCYAIHDATTQPPRRK